MLGGPKGGGTPGMRIITPGRKPLAHINPIGGTDMGGGDGRNWRGHFIC